MRYAVSFVNTTDTTIYVEATSQEEAADIAYEELNASLCHQCASQRNDGSWEVDGIEADPE